VRLTTLPPACADCLEIWEPQTPGILMGLSRPVMGLFYLHVHKGKLNLVFCKKNLTPRHNLYTVYCHELSNKLSLAASCRLNYHV
jgi:hypothetical protein